MKYFDRTNKLSNVLLATSAITFIITLLRLFKGSAFKELVEVVSNGEVIGLSIAFIIWLIITIMWFMVFILTLLMGTALKFIAKDAKEELDIIKKNHGENIKIT